MVGFLRLCCWFGLVGHRATGRLFVRRAGGLGGQLRQASRQQAVCSHGERGPGAEKEGADWVGRAGQALVHEAPGAMTDDSRRFALTCDEQ